MYEAAELALTLLHSRVAPFPSHHSPLDLTPSIRQFCSDVLTFDGGPWANFDTVLPTSTISTVLEIFLAPYAQLVFAL